MNMVLKYPGAKWRIAHWIIGFMPKHTTYLEPYFGSGAVFFNKRPSLLETINDIDGLVVNLFRVVRSRPDELIAAVEMTPWSREEYRESYTPTGDQLEDARRFLVRTWQAFGSKTSDSTGWRNEIRGLTGMNITTRWNGLPEKILAAAERLKLAQIEHQPALELIRRYKYPEVLIYADPPYLLSTRSNRIYANEMTEADHIELLDELDMHPGPVLLSGYPSAMYDERLRHWSRKSTLARTELGRQREEVLWINPVAIERLRMPLFERSEADAW